MLVIVKNNDINQAIRKLKKKVFNEGIIKELRRRESFEKPSLKRKRKKAEAIKRAKKKQFENYVMIGLLPEPEKKIKKPR